MNVVVNKRRYVKARYHYNYFNYSDNALFYIQQIIFYFNPKYSSKDLPDLYTLVAVSLPK